MAILSGRQSSQVEQIKHRAQKMGHQVKQQLAPAGKQLSHLSTEGARRIPTNVMFWGAGLSIVASLVLRVFGRKNDALFVGEWAPTMLLFGLIGLVMRGSLGVRK